MKDKIEPVGVLEISERLGVATDTVNKWRDRHADFPKPPWEVSGYLAWNWSDVLAWAKATGRA
jgi:predicted DNA-binding transcriptional regulator AlpA